MPALILNALKILFLILIFLFLWQVALAIEATSASAHLGSRSPREGGELVLLEAMQLEADRPSGSEATSGHRPLASAARTRT